MTRRTLEELKTPIGPYLQVGRVHLYILRTWAERFRTQRAIGEAAMLLDAHIRFAGDKKWLDLSQCAARIEGDLGA